MVNQLAFLIILALLTACGKQHRAHINPFITYGDLIGGSVTASADYRPTIQIQNNCTASKVGRLLFITAGHCIVEANTASIRSMYAIGNSLKIRTHYTPWNEVKLDRVMINPDYLLQRDRRINAGKAPQGIGLKVPDVAFFTVATETPEIEIGRIDLDPVLDDQNVVIGGYGCENNLGGSNPTPRFKTSVQRALKRYELHLLDNAWTLFDILNAFNINFFTAGEASDSGVASMCPGDSGGPVYRQSNGAIVGINTYYTFQTDTPSISYQNIHTRLDKIASWIMSIYADTGEVFLGASSP